MSATPIPEREFTAPFADCSFATTANVHNDETSMIRFLFTVPANTSNRETSLVDGAAELLRERLPSTWTVERSTRSSAGGDAAQPQAVAVAIEVRDANETPTTFAVEARRVFTPRDVDQLLAGLTRTLLTLGGNIPVLVVAPWLSRRTQELLAAQGINFVDLTGNARIRLENPALFISTDGARRNPEPAPRGQARVRGPKAARLIRLLADVRPPYGVRDLAVAAKLTPGYVSRLLDTLDREALIERAFRGRVESVDVPGLLRRWAESYDVLRTNEAQAFIAPQGAGEALARLGALPRSERVAITGSFAAVRVAPVAAPALLLAYCDDPEPVVDALGLLPADEGANVVLLTPFDPVVWERATEDEGRRYVAATQVTVDCLTGTGRMPAEGEALLAWMAEDEPRWRQASPLSP